MELSLKFVGVPFTFAVSVQSSEHDGVYFFASVEEYKTQRAPRDPSDDGCEFVQIRSTMCSTPREVIALWAKVDSELTFVEDEVTSHGPGTPDKHYKYLDQQITHLGEAFIKLTRTSKAKGHI